MISIFIFLLGVFFVGIGAVSFFRPYKYPWAVRFLIIFFGTGFLTYSFVNWFGLVN
ncbi:hypothetical protein M3172_22770 [Mesobacillus subterraneus]|uniref:hypothetical protein n=1 Tax=Mesobacillus subterraneus TaxID=285983 RepID=UPI00203B5CFA|nr:hypothetical protein [Mesobacillus subterraneus]MCM3575998.1 hypothetical protein [Mesobacillus subterraneus]